MKTILKYSIFTGINILLFMFLATSASAQRGGGGHGGGGGGGHMSGGGGGGHFSGGGGGSHFSGGFSGGARPSIGVARGSIAPRVGINGSPASRGGFARGRISGFGANGRTAGINGVRGNINSVRGNIRNNSAIGVRGYVRGNGPGVYGHGGRYGHYGWGRHGGYFYNGGFYGSLYFPWLGFSCWYLPYGYYSFYWGDYPYYFSDGYYYQYNNDQYTVVEPPVGAAIKTLPSNAKSVVINGQQYYELNGVYYLPVTKDDGTVEYEIAGKDGELNTDTRGAVSIIPKIGDIVVKLPPDCRKVKLNGETLFVSEDGIYYQETKDSNNNTVYKIVGLEGDDKD